MEIERARDLALAPDCVLSEAQCKLLDEFMELFSDQAKQVPFLRDRLFMVKWLQARKFDFALAQAMLRNHLRYRRAAKLDEPEFRKFAVHPVVAKYYAQGQYGFDRSGRPIVYLALGLVDPKGLLSCVRVSELFLTIFFRQEQRRWLCDEQSRRLGKPVHQVLYVLDLKGLGARHLWLPGIDAFKQVGKLMADHTPELVYKIFIINVPSVFYAIYKMIKPILDENTQQKIGIFGESGWKEALREAVSDDELPVYYGGSAVSPVDGDPRCSHTLGSGGEIPLELYFVDDVLKPDTRLTELYVSRGKHACIPLRVVKARTKISWYFKTTYDVGFSIYRLGDVELTAAEESVGALESADMIVPYMRLFTSVVPEYGHMIVDTPGNYVVLFDNSYSWIHGKQILYHVTLDESCGAEE